MTDEKKHECPYDGFVVQNAERGIHESCGWLGQLCPMCHEDRADERARALIHALGGVANSIDGNEAESDQCFRDACKIMGMPT